MIDGMELVAPRARASGLVVRELEDEVLVFDVERDKAHCLNRTAGLVWKQCDGRTSVEEIRQVLERELETPVSAEIVWKALLELGKDRLMEEEISRPGAGSRMSRRELVKRAGITIAIPVITSIAVPSIALAAGSCNPACNVHCGNSGGCTSCKSTKSTGGTSTATCAGSDGHTCCLPTDTCTNCPSQCCSGTKTKSAGCSAFTSQCA